VNTTAHRKGVAWRIGTREKLRNGKTRGWLFVRLLNERNRLKMSRIGPAVFADPSK
jgi:hypothetical protein